MAALSAALGPDSLGFEVESQDSAAYVYDGPFADATLPGGRMRQGCMQIIASHLVCTVDVHLGEPAGPTYDGASCKA